MNSNVSNIGCEVFLCDFHREQAWERWTAKSANGVSSNKEDVPDNFKPQPLRHLSQQYVEHDTQIQCSGIVA